MLGLHAAVANQYTRYNLILIGPFSIGTAWMIGRLIQYLAERQRLRVNGSPCACAIRLRSVRSNCRTVAMIGQGQLQDRDFAGQSGNQFHLRPEL